MTTPADILNQALEFIGDQQLVSYTGPAGGGGTWAGDSPAASAAGILYIPTWQMVARQTDPDFARRSTTLLLVEGATPPWWWAYEYGYPDDCLRLRALAPSAAPADPNDPQPVRFSAAFDAGAPSQVTLGGAGITLGGTPVTLGTSMSPQRVVYSNLMNALAIYTSALATEDEWDPSFTMAVVRQLANPLAMALAGRPDFAVALLEQAARYEALSMQVDESAALR